MPCSNVYMSNQSICEWEVGQNHSLHIKYAYPRTVTDASVVNVDSRDFQKIGFHLLSSSPGFLPLAPSSSSSGVGIPGMEVKARARRDRCVWGIVRGWTRRCRGDDALMSLCKMSGRNDDMVVQRQTTNLIKRATAALEERVLSWTDETPGVKTDRQTDNGFCLAIPRLCL